MKEFIKLIKEYKTTNNKKAYFLVILERSGKIHFPTYSLIQLVNSISNDPTKITSSEGWIEKEADLQQEKKVFEEEKIELKKDKIVFENNKKDNFSFKKKYLIIPAIISVLILVFFAVIPIFKSTEENKLWDKVCIENTMSSYEYYLNHYPEGKHINEALRKKGLALEKEEEMIWEKVVRTNTKRSYLNYLSNNKNSTKYKKEANEKLDEIDWVSAQNKNTYAEYKKYLSSYPSGNHIAEARTEKNKIAVRNVNNTIISWINCWQEKDLNCFNSFISNDYTYETATGNNKNKLQNKSERLSNLKSQFNKRSYINISITNLNIKLLEDKMAIVNYSQKYESNSWNDEGLKTLYLRYTNNEWKIYRDIFK